MITQFHSENRLMCCVWPLADLNDAARNTGLQVSVGLLSHIVNFFNFWGSYQAVVHGGCILHSF